MGRVGQGHAYDTGRAGGGGYGRVMRVDGWASGCERGLRF